MDHSAFELQRRRLAQSRSVRLGSAERTDFSPEYRLVKLIYELSAELECNPDFYQGGEGAFWLHFHESALDLENFIQLCATWFVEIEPSYHLLFLGDAENQESALVQLAVNDRTEAAGNCLEAKLFDESGRKYAWLAEPCILVYSQPECDTDDWRDFFTAFDYRHSILVLKRHAFGERLSRSFPEVMTGSYFRYLPISDEYADHGISAALAALSVADKTRLWRVYLLENYSPSEFYYALEAMKVGNLPARFSWELSLRLVLNEIGFRIENDEAGFRIYNKAGSRLYYTYETQSDAEKLFLKILFPLSAPANDQ